MKLFPLKIDQELELRLLTLADSNAQYALLDRNRNHIGQWEGWAQATTEDEQYAFLSTCLKRYEDELGFACGIWFQDTLIGVITAATVALGQLEMSYWLSEDYTRNGIMSQCMQTLCMTLLNLDTISQLNLVVASPNTASRALAIRIGFRESSTIPNDIELNGKYIDRVVYTLSKS